MFSHARTYILQTKSFSLVTVFHRQRQTKVVWRKMSKELKEFEKFSKDMATFNTALNVFRNILLVTGIASNLLVCAVMIKKKDQRKTLSKFFIFHLALADFAFRILGIYKKTVEQVKDGAISPPHCKAVVFFQYTCETVLFALLAGIAMDRGKNVVQPLKSFKTRYCHRKKAIILVWIYAVLISAGFINSATSRRLTRQFKGHRNNSTTDNITDTKSPDRVLVFRSHRAHCLAGPHGSLQSQIAFSIYFVCGFLVPLCVMIISYTRVFCFLSYRAKHSMLNRSVVKSKFKTLFILVMLVFSFLVSWGPITVLELIQSYSHLAQDIRVWLRPLTECLCYSSSILNPIFYAFGNESFRKEAISLILCNRKLKCFQRI